MADVYRFKLEVTKCNLKYRSKFEITDCDIKSWRRRYLPYAFTENGIAMPLPPQQHPHTVLLLIK